MTPRRRPTSDARFDSVVSNFGIHHVPRPALALAGAHRILRQGGQFAFSIWAGHERQRRLASGVRRDAAAWRSGCLGRAAAGWRVRRHRLPDGDGGRRVLPGWLLGSSNGVWRHPNAASLLSALRAGTARMAAMIEAQTETAMPEIIASLEAAAAPWRDAAGIAVPIACIIIAGIRS